MDAVAPIKIEGHDILRSYEVSLTSSPNEVVKGVLEAVADNNLDRFKSLLEAILDSDPEGRSKDEWNIVALSLLSAAEKGHQKIVEFLLEKEDGEVNWQNSEGFTALDLASANGHLQIVEVLLGYKETKVWRPMGTNLLHLAVQNGHLPVVKSILSKQAIRFVHFFYTCDGSYISSSDEDTDDLLDYPNHYGSTPLHLAAKNGHRDIEQLLMSKGAEILKDEDRNTPLHLAAREGHEQIVEDLLYTVVYRDNCSGYYDEYDGDGRYGTPCVNWPNGKGKTPLHLASERGLDGIVHILLSNSRTNVNAIRSGSAALHLATQGGHVQVVKLLSEHQQIKNSTDGRGRTALTIAQQEGNFECIEILRERFGK